MTSDQQVSPSQVPPHKGWRNRRVPLLILGTFVAVIIASTLLFRAAVLGDVDLPRMFGTNNNGVLITPPQPIADLPIRLGDGAEFRYSALPPQWSLLIPAGRSCDQACAQTLYITRQIHTALGKEASRVRRFVLTGAEPIDPAFEKLLLDHPKLQVLHVDSEAAAQFFAKTGAQGLLENSTYFVVDSQGWVMMYYTSQHNGKAVLSDLKFLLKNSHEQEGVN